MYTYKYTQQYLNHQKARKISPEINNISAVNENPRWHFREHTWHWLMRNMVYVYIKIFFCLKQKFFIEIQRAGNFYSQFWGKQIPLYMPQKFKYMFMLHVFRLQHNTFIQSEASKIPTKQIHLLCHIQERQEFRGNK